MESLLASAEAILSLVGIAAIGFYALHRKIIAPEMLKTLSTVAIELSLPFYVFANLTLNFRPESSPGWWRLPLWWMLFAALTFPLSLAAGRLFHKGIRREASLSIYLYNPTFVAMAVISGIFGGDSPYIADLFLFTMFTIMYQFNIYPVFFQEKGAGMLPSISKFDWKKIFNPLIKATFVALLFRLSGADAYLPKVVFTIAKQVGSMASPLIMLIFGGYVYLDMQRAGKIHFLDVFKYVAIKNVLLPLATLGLLYLAHPNFNVALLLLLSAAAPMLSTVPIFVERFHGDVEIANQFLVGSFVLSVFSIPVMIMILNWIYS